MYKEKLIRRYLESLEKGNYEHMMQWFADDATVHSPLYGKVPAGDFYRDLFQDTGNSRITLLHVFQSETPGVAAAHFRYDWELADGTPVDFECVDVFYFNPEQKISELTIIYDTVQTREAFRRLKS